MQSIGKNEPVFPPRHANQTVKTNLDYDELVFPVQTIYRVWLLVAYYEVTKNINFKMFNYYISDSTETQTFDAIDVESNNKSVDKSVDKNVDNDVDDNNFFVRIDNVKSTIIDLEMESSKNNLSENNREYFKNNCSSFIAK